MLPHLPLGAALLAAPAIVHSPRAPLAPSAAPLELAQRGRPKKVEAPPLAPFLGTVEEAKASARERNVPLLIHIVLEGEPQNDEYRDTILPDAALRALSQRAVVVVANNGEHEPRTIREELEDRVVERQVCSAYEMFARCEQHRATWDPLYFEFHDPDGEMRCPQTILLAPAGEVAWRHNVANPPPTADVRSALERAQEKAGKGLTLDELTAAKRQLSAGRLATKDEQWPRALRSWKGILDAVAAGPLFDEATAGVVVARKAIRAELEAVRKLLVPGTAKEGYLRLAKLAEELEGTPLEDEVSSALQAAERDREIRDEVRAAQLELEAEELWAEAEERFRAGDERKGEVLIRRILRKKYRDTDVAKRARERYPEIAAEEDRNA